MNTSSNNELNPNDITSNLVEVPAGLSRQGKHSVDTFEDISTPTSASELLPDPWDYKPHLAKNELEIEYKWFLLFLQDSKSNLGRSLLNVSAHFDVTLEEVSKVSEKNHWKLRAKAFDDHLLLQRMDEERIKRHNQHMEKLEGFRRKSETLGTALITSGAQMLNVAHRTLQEMQESGETLDRKLLAGALNAAAKVAESGRLLTGQSLGVEELIRAFNSDDDHDQ